MVGREVRRVAGVLALRAERDEEVLARHEARLAEDREHDVARGARVGGALEDDELSAAQRSGDRVGAELTT
jgi:hypothetical protein